MKILSTVFAMLQTMLCINAFAQAKFQEYYGVPPFNYEVGHGVAKALDGGYFFAGETHDNAGLVPWDLYVIKTNASGIKQWSKRYSNLEGSNHPAGNIISTSDSGFAMAPMTNSGDLRIVKFDKNGNFLWSKQYGAGYGSPRSIIQTSDGGFALVGDEYYFTPSVFKSYVVKTDAFGNMQWDKALFTTSTLRGCDIVQNTDNSYVICGIDQSWQPTGNVLLYKLSSNGNLIWCKSIGTPALDEAYSIKKTADNGFIISGNTSINGNDIMLIKTDSAGVVEWAYAYGTPSYDGNYISHSLDTDADGGYSFFGYTMTGTVGSADLLLLKTTSNGDVAWSRTYGSIYSESGYTFGLQANDGGYVISGRRAGNLLGDILAIKTNAVGSCGCNESSITLLKTTLTLTSTNVTPLLISGGLTSVKNYSTTNIYNDSTIVCLTGIPLPIELVLFNAKSFGDSNLIEWETASETNNNFFEVEKSADGENYIILEKINGAGNSSSILHYSAYDKNPYNGANYYRLKQVDFNGGFTLSPVIAVNNFQEYADEILHYDILNQKLIIFIKSNKPDVVSIELYNITGSIIDKKYSPVNSPLIINTKSYPKGVYLLKIHSNNLCKSFKQNIF